MLALCALTLGAAEAAPVPQACAMCRYVTQEGPFMQCLADCLGRTADRPAGTAAALRELRWQGWQTRRTGLIERASENIISRDFGRENRARLALRRQGNKNVMVLTLDNMSFHIMDVTADFSFDGQKPVTVRADRDSSTSAMIVSNPQILRALRNASRVSIAVEPFGEKKVRADFTLPLIKEAMDSVYP